jgi:hypothetical protein
MNLYLLPLHLKGMKREKQIERLARSAARIICETCPARDSAYYSEQFRPDGCLFGVAVEVVKALIMEGTPAINIPRQAAKEFLGK